MAVGTAPDFPSRRERKMRKGAWFPGRAPFSLQSHPQDLALVEVRISAGHPWHSGVRSGPDRMIGVAVLGATDAADEMIGNLRNGQPLRQVETAGVNVEMTRRPAVAAVHLQGVLLNKDTAGEIALMDR